MQVTRVIAAAPDALFELLTDPRTHARLDGSGTVLGDPKRVPRLRPGGVFTMGMQQFGASYRSTNEVVEFEPGRRLAWRSTRQWRGRTVVGGQRWRYVLHHHPGGTLVEHAYGWGYARLPLLDSVAARLSAADATGYGTHSHQPGIDRRTPEPSAEADVEP